MNRVLFIDDEEFVLKVIEKKFENTKIKCYFASSGKEALDLIERIEMDVIVADIQMPEQDGIEFFKIVKKISPRSVRIILSGYVRTASIIEGINEGHVYKYIQKPWKIDEKAIRMIEEAIAVSKCYQEEKNDNYSINIEELLKFKGLKEWVLLDSRNQIVSQNTDYPIDSSVIGESYRWVHSSKGELKLIELGN